MLLGLAVFLSCPWNSIEIKCLALYLESIVNVLDTPCIRVRPSERLPVISLLGSHYKLPMAAAG